MRSVPLFFDHLPEEVVRAHYVSRLASVLRAMALRDTLISICDYKTVSPQSANALTEVALAIRIGAETGKL